MKPYVPSNGTEGMVFYDQWCSRCKSAGYGELEQAWQECEEGIGPAPKAHEYGQGCPILCRTLIYDVGHKLYPTEWVVDDDGFSNPRCTAFSDEDPPPPVDPNQLTLPMEENP